MKTMWIDHDLANLVDVGFLIESSNPLQGSERHYLADRPPYTNQSHQPRPVGWCGSYNDVSTYGHGVWRVVRVAKNGRVKIQQVTDKAELVAFLEDVGYPGLIGELIDDAMPPRLSVDDAVVRYWGTYGLGGKVLFDEIDRRLVHKDDVINLLPRHGWDDLKSHPS